MSKENKKIKKTQYVQLKESIKMIEEYIDLKIAN